MANDLEERTFIFARNTALFLKTLKKTVSNKEYGVQLLRSSASIEANYIEANENLGEKDFLMKIKICRREAKESSYWLRLIKETDDGCPDIVITLIDESRQLRNILTAIMNKSI
jgi:four helix bundle protein